MEDKLYDVVIVGGGPAGLTAALYCCRDNMSTLLFEPMLMGGMVNEATLIENYPGFPNGINGYELSATLLEHAKKFGLKEEIAAVYEGLETSPVCAVAVPVKDTLKKTSVSKDGKVMVESTPNRGDYYAVRTPQGFRYSELMKCVDYYASEEGTHATDDTLIAERCGLPVTLVEGSYANIKITTPEDVAVAREIVRSRWQKQPFED